MVCKPRKWKHNAGGGYLNNTESVILGAMNHHEKKQALSSINILQEIPWELDKFMLKFEEEPNKELDTEEKVMQFQQFKEESREIYNKMLARGNKFYFQWNKDKRGREYCKGYHITLQGTQYKKAILSFADKEVMLEKSIRN
jgi:hypothetical protein